MEGYLTRAGGWMEKLTDTQSKKASSHSTKYLQNTTSHSFFSLATTFLLMKFPLPQPIVGKRRKSWSRLLTNFNLVLKWYLIWKWRHLVWLHRFLIQFNLLIDHFDIEFQKTPSRTQYRVLRYRNQSSWFETVETFHVFSYFLIC